MGFQSKTYSLSDEVVEAISAAKLAGESPNQYLVRLIAGGRKPNKAQREVIERAAGDFTAQVTEREDIDYSSLDSVPSTHVATLEPVSYQPRSAHERKVRWKGPLSKPSEGRKK